MDDLDFKVKIKSRLSKKITLEIPIDVQTSLETVSNHKDMSIEALMKFYIGQGLRNDMTFLYSELILKRTEQVLSQHIQSKEEISTILQEITAGTAPEIAGTV